MGKSEAKGDDAKMKNGMRLMLTVWRFNKCLDTKLFAWTELVGQVLCRCAL